MKSYKQMRLENSSFFRAFKEAEVSEKNKRPNKSRKTKSKPQKVKGEAREEVIKELSPLEQVMTIRSV